jgi:LacI family transcriptional regulator, gluconate utilization system Gnt-I transcriptional repressor
LAAKDNKGTGRAVRVEDVARVAGVSPITVSRALSYPEKVKEETRKRVADAVAQTGYVVNSFASSLRSGRSSIITVFVSSLRNPHFATSMQGLVDAFEGSRFHLMFAQTGYSEMLDMNVVASVLPFRPAGVVFTGVVRAEPTRDSLRKLGIPVLEMWGYRPDPIDMLVGFSNQEGGRRMGDHLGGKGYRRVCYCGHTLERGAERIAGLREGLAAHGAELVKIVPMEGTRQIADGMAAFDAARAGHEGVDAIFFGTDVMASGGLERALQLGVDVPGEMGIAGYGGLDFAGHMHPPLTTIDIPTYEMGFTAGRMMLRRLAGTSVDQPVMLHEISLQARQSTNRAV